MLMLQNKVTDLFTSFIKNLVTSCLHSSQCCDIYLHCHPVSFSSVCGQLSIFLLFLLLSSKYCRYFNKTLFYGNSTERPCN